MADWWVNDVEPWWGEQKDKVLNIGMSITEDAKDLWRDIKSLWFGAGDKIANLKFKQSFNRIEGRAKNNISKKGITSC